EIYKVNTVSLVQTRLTTNETDDANPVYSPDGLKIAFQSDRDDPNQPSCEGSGTCKYETYTMLVDGTSQTNVSNNITANDTTPDWQSVQGVITVGDFFFSPTTVKPKQGGALLWDFLSQNAEPHTAT